MDLSRKNKRRLKRSPSIAFWLICFFFFLLPAIPIILILISGQSNQMGGVSGPYSCELTEEGKRVFEGKEQLIDTYMAASQRFQIPWEYLAAIHQLESNFSLSTTPQMDEEVTADTPIEQLKVGPMGFLERNWVGWGDAQNDFFAEYPDARTPRSDDGDLKNSFHPTMINLNVIEKYKGVGVDGNGDGKADPYNVDDAIFTAANKLRQDGFDRNIRQALARYNNQQDFPRQVENLAQELAGGLVICSGSPGLEHVPSGNVRLMLEEAYQQYENRTITYFYGAENYPVFDCSSWVQYMYKKHLGISLPRTTFLQVNEGQYVPKDQLQPGDLIFFAYPGQGPHHVGMYFGNGKMIHNCCRDRDMAIDSIMTGHYYRTYHSARRIIQY